MTNEQRQELATLRMDLQRAEQHLLMRALGRNTPELLKEAGEFYADAHAAYREKNREYNKKV